MTYKLSCFISLLLAIGIAPAQINSSKTATKVDRSAAAAQMLILTDQARHAIAKGNKPDAIQNVTGALDLAADAQGPRIPIYAEMEQLSIVGPITAEKRRQTGAADRLGPVKSSPDVQEASEFTIISVDMEMAKAQLNAAKTALTSGTPQDADKALAMLQNRVDLLTVESHMPLLKARQNLYLAKTMAQQGRLGDAIIPLRTASEALTKYSKNPTARHADDAAKKRQEIDSQIGTLGEDAKAASTKIDIWWNQTVDWFSQEQPKQ